MTASALLSGKRHNKFKAIDYPFRMVPEKY